MTMKNKDFLLIGMPMRELNYPPMALALLKSVLHNQGYDVAVADANLEYFKHCGRDDPKNLVNTFHLQNTVPVTIKEIDESDFGIWSRKYLKQLITKHNPRAIGLSVFTFKSNLAAYYMGKLIHEIAPKSVVKIIGGYGATSPLQYARELGATPKPTLAETMVADGIIDTYILGDGERAIVEFMKNLDFKNPEEPRLMDNMDDIPYPDFSDLDLGSYQYANNLTLPVTGSKGCVRKCSFCDIPGKWGRFRQRPGKTIAEECIHMYETYGARTLYLTDSLTNGNMKEFIQFITHLAEMKTKKGYKDLKWTGQYITRPAHQIPHNKDYYPLMAASGAVGLSVGSESGSNRVLEHMRKKMKIEDLFIELEYFRKHGISMTAGLLPSYPTETREDFELTLKMLKGFQPYLADGTIIHIGGIAKWYSQDNHNEWSRKGEEQGWYFNGSDPDMWWYKHNPELTLQERVFRRVALSKILVSYDIPSIMDEEYELKTINNWYALNQEKYDKFLNGISAYKEWKINAWA